MEKFKIVPLNTKKKNIKSLPNMDNGLLVKAPFSMVMSGKTKSGKTQLLMNLLTKKHFYKDYFDLIFVVSNTAEDGDDLYDHLKLKKNQIYKPNAKGLAQIEHIIETQKQLIKEDGIENTPSILIIFDDMANEKKFLNSDTYLKLHIMNRHYNISVISLYQSYMKAPRSCRIQIDGLFYFKGKESETTRISEEHCPAGYTEKEFRQLVNYATKEPYSFLYINYDVDHKDRYRKRFYEIMELDK
jgi:hypothetical protein